MNILLLTTHLNIGGIAVYIVNLAKALKKKGHRAIVASSGGELVDELEKAGIAHIRLDVKTKSELSTKLVPALMELVSLVRANEVDIIHAHTRVTQVIASLASKICGIPYVVTCHGFFSPRLGRRLFGCWGTRTIAISDAVKEHLIRDFHVPAGRIDLIYNGVDPARFRKIYTKTDQDALRNELRIKEGRVIGTIGRLSPVKGYRYLVEAFAQLRRMYDDLQLLIVGEGPEREMLQDIARDSEIENYVHFARPRLDTPAILSLIDVFVSSSIQEGLGLSIAEAMAAGKPVVASDVGGVSSLVKNKRTGLLVKPKDTRAIAEAVIQVLGDAELREKLSASGKRMISRLFTIDKMLAKVEGTYAEAIKAKKTIEPRRILIVTVNWLGDVLFTTPFIKALRRKFPGSHIACLVVPRAKELLEDNPNVNELVIYDEYGEHESLIGKARLVSELRKKRFDTAFILHRSFTRALIVLLSGVKNRIGYNTKHRGLLLTRAAREPGGTVHKVEYFLNLAAECLAPTDDKDYEFFVQDRPRGEMADLLKGCGIEKDDMLIVLNPGGNWPPKRWPKENFTQLADRLASDLHVKVVITGGGHDVSLADEIARLAKSKPAVFAGKTTIKQLAALMERAALVISSDSGPMHLALAVRTKVIALFGPTSDLITGPYGTCDFAVLKKEVNCRIPCYDVSCDDHRCMKAISVDDVMAKVKEMLEKRTKDEGRRTRDEEKNPVVANENR